MSGYTGGTVPEEPDYQLVKDLKAAGCRVMAEGRYNTPELAKTAIETWCLLRDGWLCINAFRAYCKLVC